MQKLITYDLVKSKIIEIRGQNVILDSDVAELYGVESREINQAVKRNLEKFPTGYLLELSTAYSCLTRSTIPITPDQ
jgi:hypothetical protein